MRLFSVAAAFVSLSATIVTSHNGEGEDELVVPVPNLPFGDINVVVMTDVHSWVAGHENGADYGDVVSFVDHLKEYAKQSHHDIFFVMNGDWIDGTGIAMNGDPSKLIPILEQIPFDAINVGNHELYKNSVIAGMTDTASLVDRFGNHYLSSNVLFTDTMKPIGSRYHILQGTKTNVLTFGFLFNMTDSADSVTVIPIQQAVKEDWFVTALQTTEMYDAILVLAHMDVQDPLVTVILDQIRSLAGNVPVQFITGHTHYRGYVTLDDNAASFEAGRFLDTVGFVSFPTQESTKTTSGGGAAQEIAQLINVTKNETQPPVAASSFQHVFLDANKVVLSDALGLSSPADLATPDGVELSQFIERVRIRLGLLEVIGCVNSNYYLNRSLYETDSVWRLFQREVVPSRLDKNAALIISNGEFRYDLPKGEVRVDNAINVAPFNDTLIMWPDVPYDIIVKLNETLNADGPSFFLPRLPLYFLSTVVPLEPAQSYNLMTPSFSNATIQRLLDAFYPNGTIVPHQQLMSGLTTTGLWLEYFRENSPCRGSSSGGGMHGSQPTSPTLGDSAADSARLMFVAIAIGVVAVLGSIVVWQKGVLWRHQCETREFATLAAIEEYEGGYGDDEEEEEEGEFVVNTIV